MRVAAPLPISILELLFRAASRVSAISIASAFEIERFFLKVFVGFEQLICCIAYCSFCRRICDSEQGQIIHKKPICK